MNDYHGLFQHQSSYSVWKSAAVAEKNEGNSPALIGKPQLGILWSRDSLGFKRLCGNNPGTMWSKF